MPSLSEADPAIDRALLNSVEAAYEQACERVRDAKRAVKAAKAAAKDAKQARKRARKALMAAHEQCDQAESAAHQSATIAAGAPDTDRKPASARIPDSPERRRTPRKRKATPADRSVTIDGAALPAIPDAATDVPLPADTVSRSKPEDTSR